MNNKHFHNTGLWGHIRPFYITTIFLAVILFSLLLCRQNVHAENLFYSDVEIEDSHLIYTLTEDGTLTINGQGPIPSKEKGVTIKVQSYPWYNHRNGITRVIVGDGVTDLNAACFDQMPNLKYISLPATAVNIPFSSLFANSKLQELTLAPDQADYYVLDTAVYSRTEGKMVFYPPDSRVTRLEIPEGISTITGKITSSYLEEISIPNSLTSFPLLSCINLTRVETSQDHPVYQNQDGVLFTNNGKTLYYYPRGRRDPAYTVPDQVTKIGSNAFENAIWLKHISWGDQITTINTAAFKFCISLKEVTLPQALNSLGASAFHSCYSLQKVTLNSKIDRLQSSVFAYCLGLKSIDLPSSLKIMDQYVFSRSGLERILIPDHVYRIDSYVFKDCKNLREARLSSNLTSIPDSTFEGCQALEYVSLSRDLTQIGQDAFLGCDSLAFLSLPQGVDSIAFTGISAQTRVYYEGEEGSLTGDTGNLVYGQGAPDLLKQVRSAVFTYDGQPHSLQLPELGTEIYFSTQDPLTADNYLEKGSLTLPERTSCGESKVYYYCPEEDMASLVYIDILPVIDSEASLLQMEYDGLLHDHRIQSQGDPAITWYGANTYKSQIPEPALKVPGHHVHYCIADSKEDSSPRCQVRSFCALVIDRISLTAADMKLTPGTYAYTGKPLKPVPVLTYKGKPLDMDQCQITWENNTEPGTGRLMIEGIDYYTGSLETSFTIYGNMKEAKVTLPAKSYVYKGKAISPRPTVSLHGKALTAGKHYKVTYENHNQPGTGKVVLTGLGDYSGKTEATFQLKLGQITLTSVKPAQKGLALVWTKVPGAASYKIYRKKDSAKSFTLVKTVTTGKTWTDTSVKNACLYHYYVKPQAVSSKGAKINGAKSEEKKYYWLKPIKLTKITYNKTSKELSMTFNSKMKEVIYLDYSFSNSFQPGERTTVKIVPEPRHLKEGYRSFNLKNADLALKSSKRLYFRIYRYKKVQGSSYTSFRTEKAHLSYLVKK